MILYLVYWFATTYFCNFANLQCHISAHLMETFEQVMPDWACSLVGVGAGLGWLVLVFCERKTLLAGWFGLVETNKRTG